MTTACRLDYGERIALEDFSNAIRRLGVPPTPVMLLVRVPVQEVTVWRHEPGAVDGVAGGVVRAYRRGARLRASTSRYGIGQVMHSNRTPLGLHRIAEKYGAGWPVGTVFKQRCVAGFTWRGHTGAAITHRILWLDGLEPGFNRGGSVDTHERYIYIHGTGAEPTLGRPASHGCVHLAAADLIPLHEALPSGTLVWIANR